MPRFYVSNEMGTLLLRGFISNEIGLWNRYKNYDTHFWFVMSDQTETLLLSFLCLTKQRLYYSVFYVRPNKDFTTPFLCLTKPLPPHLPCFLDFIRIPFVIS